MSAQIDCPICMDCIESTTKNCVTTECGHCFHTNCLMKSVAHNGFGCPYCRNKMAEEPREKNYFDDEYSIEDDNTIFDDDALTSFRMFNQRINDEEVEEEEPEEWETVNGDEQEEVIEEEHYSHLPSSSYVAEKLAEKGITYEDLVKSLLECEHNYPDFRRRSAEVYGQFRIVLTRYDRQNQERLRVNRAAQAVVRETINVEEDRPVVVELSENDIEKLRAICQDLLDQRQDLI
jgi:hypothetical protein